MFKVSALIVAAALVVVQVAAEDNSLRAALLSELESENAKCSGPTTQGASQTCGSNNYCLCGQNGNVPSSCSSSNGYCYPGNLREGAMCSYNEQCTEGTCANGACSSSTNIKCGPLYCDGNLQVCSNCWGLNKYACVNKCSKTSDCGKNQACINGGCEQTKVSNGGCCIQNSQCTSAYCSPSTGVCASKPMTPCGNIQCDPSGSTPVCSYNPYSFKYACVKACSTNSNCGSNAICLNGGCQPSNLNNGGSCMVNNQCKTQYCNPANGQCANKPSIPCGPNLSCVIDSSAPVCSFNYLANVYMCVAACSSNSNCGSGNFCINGGCQQGYLSNGASCFQSNQCLSQYCSPSTGVCGTKPATPCGNSYCQVDSKTPICMYNPYSGSYWCVAYCQSNLDCGTNNVCYNSGCLPGNLPTNAQCVLGSQCQSNYCPSGTCQTQGCGNVAACVAPTTSCSYNAYNGVYKCVTPCTSSTATQVCGNNNVCFNGGCQPGNLKTGAQCMTNSQCQSGTCYTNATCK